MQVESRHQQQQLDHNFSSPSYHPQIYHRNLDTSDGILQALDSTSTGKFEREGGQEMNNTQGFPYGQPYTTAYASGPQASSQNSQGHYSQSQYGHQHQQPQQQYGQPPPHQQHQSQQHQQQQQQQQYPQYRSQTQLPPLSQTGLAAPSSGSLPGIPRLGTSYPPQPNQSLYGHPSLAPQGMQPRGATQAVAQALQDIEGEDAQYKYRLEVVQQPRRARMCGFGDKDRRPITPPPCVKLFITDKTTGKNVPPGAFENHGCFFVLSVDLWDESGSREVNVVRTNGTSPAPSISNSTTTSYPPPPERAMMGHPYGGYVQGPDGMMFPMQNYNQDPFYNPPYGGVQSQASSSTMMTRNLIGSLTVNATILVAPKDTPAFWFVLQDLSVRTEGWFRLKMNFIDVGAGMNNAQLNKGKAPVLATTFSEKFQVFSAKKFPGVIESTPLSKEFAHQGIKIPIRKDNSKAGNDGGSDDEGSD